jgi:hypothetical protein
MITRIRSWLRRLDRNTARSTDDLLVMLAEIDKR